MGREISTHEISTLPRLQARDIGSLFGIAFKDDPLSAWLIPSFARRLNAMAEFFMFMAEECIASGAADVWAQGGRLVGAALWSGGIGGGPPLDGGTSISYVIRRTVAALGEDGAERWRIAAGAMHNARPNEDHAYLALIGVDPCRQRQGVAESLISERLDALPPGRGAYLEASTEGAVALYRRLGFEARPPFTVPDGGPEMYPMWHPGRQ